METIEFNQLIEKVKKENPMIFCLESDCKANITKIEMIENYYGIVLPKSYKEFLMQYGGGYFAYTIVYSADDESPYYLISNVDKQFSKIENIFLFLISKQVILPDLKLKMEYVKIQF